MSHLIHPVRCFLDMDGVVADFVGAIHKAHGRQNVYTDPQNFNVFETEKIWNMPAQEFWKFDSHDFWRDVEKMPEADELVDYVLDLYGTENTAFLTSPSNSGGVYTGKREWLAQHFPVLKNNVIFAKAGVKKMMASPYSLLIDDRNENVEDFSRNGGRAILMPRPWNRLYRHRDHSLEWVKFELNRIEEKRRNGISERE